MSAWRSLITAGKVSSDRREDVDAAGPERLSRTGRKARCSEIVDAGSGALEKIRTPDPQIRSLLANSFILLIRMKLSAYMQLKQQFN